MLVFLFHKPQKINQIFGWEKLWQTSGLCYKHTTIVNYTSSVVNKLDALFTDDTRVVIYDCHLFIVQATVQQTYSQIID
jgi:hypothetical protein